MNAHKFKVKIIPAEKSSIELNTRSLFWKYISNRSEKEINDPERLEYTFKKRFTRELKQNLIKKFQNELHLFESNYHVDFRSPFIDDYFHKFYKHIEKDERVYLDDFVNGFARLQELKNSYYKDNKEYQKLLTKNLLATQIEFDIENITYSSLIFDLNIEPFDKALKLFDNNYELIRIFLDQFIPESFLSSLSIYNDSIPISVSIEYLQVDYSVLKKPIIINEPNTLYNANHNEPQSKWDKAKWAWILTNSSLVVPVILALLILYFTFNKFESMEDLRQENQKEINIERYNLFKNYQELINLQMNSYQDLIKVIEKDSLE